MSRESAWYLAAEFNTKADALLARRALMKLALRRGFRSPPEVLDEYRAITLHLDIATAAIIVADLDSSQGARSSDLRNDLIEWLERVEPSWRDLWRRLDQPRPDDQVL